VRQRIPTYLTLPSTGVAFTTMERPKKAPEERANAPAVGNKRLRDFEIENGVYVVTGGGRGLGCNLAEGLCEAGGEVHCLDRLEEPDAEFLAAQKNARPEFGGSLHYHRVDVQNTDELESVMASIAARHSRLDGLIAAAGVQQITPAVEYKVEDVREMLNINYVGVFMAATSAARQMFKYKCRGSIVLIASMSGLIANKGLISPVYNSSKAAVTQLARNLAMEWGKGSGGRDRRDPSEFLEPRPYNHAHGAKEFRGGTGLEGEVGSGEHVGPAG